MSELAARIKNLSPAKRQLLQQRLKEKGSLAEPIAIVGMACRFAGARSVDDFWRMIRGGETAIAEVPESRWNSDEFYDPSAETPGKMTTRHGAFVDAVDQFDPMFFGIAPREASRMDPQQRLLLEVAWESLEGAGFSVKGMAGSRTGVFIGIGGTDYAKLPSHYEDYFEQIDAYVGTGNAHSIAANRISYLFDFHGPSLSVDTACSSGLVALHCAVQSLRDRECDAALAGGVNLILSPEVTIAFSKARMLSPDGKCRPFDESANGYVRGEGCGLIVLKRLHDAVQNGDNILAVIRATGTNQDGKTSGITAPNGLSQQQLIRETLDKAGLTEDRISYVEAHGTGTPLGDPIEAEALTQVFPRKHDEDPPCYVTSVKANVGHTETVSGIAGLIKTVLMLQHGVIPAQPLLQKLNPYISLDGSRIEIPQREVAWPRGREPRAAGVSSFGFGGTNVHVIIEEAAPSDDPASDAIDRPRHILALSAKDTGALQSLADRYLQRIRQESPGAWEDFCATANQGGSHFNQRAAVVAGNRQEMLSQLEKVAAGGRGRGIKTGEARLAKRPGIAFLFTGQGSQYAGMGRQLYETQPLFRQTLDQCEKLLRDRLEHPLLSVIFADESDDGQLNQTAYTQPALFAVEYSLARLWMSWGIQPDFVLGHSVGEYVAACIADVFSLEDGLQLIAERGRLMQQLSESGTMAVVFASPQEVENRLAGSQGRVSIAAANGPGNTVISGDSQEVSRLVEEFEQAGVGSKRLPVSHAFHSPLMDPILEPFAVAARQVQYRRGRIDLVSNLTASVETAGLLDADYWVRHIRETVRFADGMQTLMQRNPAVILEVGPAPQLIGMSLQLTDRKDLLRLPSLRKGQDDWTSILDSLAGLYVAGVEIDWRGFERGYRRRKVSLPTYPFQRSRQWQDPEAPERRFGCVATYSGRQPTLHPLLGHLVPTALDKTLYEADLVNDQVGYLKDHQVQGSVVVPAAAFVEMALAAAEQAFGSGPHRLEEVSIRQAMYLPADGTRTIQMSVDNEQYGGCRFACHSASGEGDAAISWTLHATGKTCRRPAEGETDAPSLNLRQQIEDVREHHDDVRSGDEFYRLMAARQLSYGERFQVLGRTWRCQDRAVAEIELPEAVAAQLDQYTLHPALLDGCFQAAAHFVPLEKDGSFSRRTYMPTAIREVRVHQPPAPQMQIFARRTSSSDHAASAESVQGDVFLVDDEANVLVELLGVKIQRVGQAAETDDSDSHRWLYEIAWEENAAELAETNQAATLDGTWLVLADDSGVADKLIPRMESAGADVVRVSSSDFDPGEERSFLDRLEALRDDAPLPSAQLRGAVHLWSLDIADPHSPGALQHSQRLGCTSAMQIVQALARFGAAGIATLFFTRQSQAVLAGDRPANVLQSPLWGLIRCAAIEHPELGCRLVDLEQDASPDDLAGQVIEQLRVSDEETQVAIRGRRRCVTRLREAAKRVDDGGENSVGQLKVPAGVPIQLRLAAAGSFDGLRVAPLQRQIPGPGQIEVEVRATGLNFSDVLKTLGLYPGITDSVVPLGIECSGIVTAVGDDIDRFSIGDAVCGVVPYGFASHALTAQYAMVHKPARLDHEEAATIPIAFMTAYYALRQLAGLQKNERVLIHAGAGGVGLAAIQIAQDIGAEVFATAGSDQKRQFLRNLGVRHVMDSRTLDFAEQILEITGGDGVDVVLNSLPGDAIDRSLGVLRSYGRFLEIGKTDIYQNRAVGLSPFQDNLSYFAIDLDRMLRQRPEAIGELFAAVMRGFDDGRYQPLAMTNFSFPETRDAFRFMAQRKNIGKVVVSMGQPKGDSSGESRNRKGGTYLITGGLGALGQRVAQSYASRGVGHLVLMSRCAPSPESEVWMERLRRLGVSLCAVQGDVARADSLAAAMQQIPDEYPPLAGVVHAAGVLDDGVLFDMSPEKLARVMAPKIDGAWNLHVALKDADIIDFVLFSSVASVLGSPGQANYAAGNAFLDALAHHRRAMGLAATAINWGPWADAGMAAGDDRQSQVTSRGMDLLPVEASLELLHQLLESEVVQATVMRVRWEQMLQAYRGSVPPLLSGLAAAVEGRADHGSSDQGVDVEFCEKLAGADAALRQEMIASYFVDQLSVIMGLGHSEIDQELPLSSLGLDSLMAIELKNQVETRLGVVLPMARFMEGPSVASLAEAVAELFQPPTTPSDSD